MREEVLHPAARPVRTGVVPAPARIRARGRRTRCRARRRTTGCRRGSRRRRGRRRRRASARRLVMNTSVRCSSRPRSARPSGCLRSRPTDRLPRLADWKNGSTPRYTLCSPAVTRLRYGSPVSGCSILMTSAPHSVSTEPAIGTNTCVATSSTRTFASGLVDGHRNQPASAAGLIQRLLTQVRCAARRGPGVNVMGTVRGARLRAEWKCSGSTPGCSATSSTRASSSSSATRRLSRARLDPAQRWGPAPNARCRLLERDGSKAAAASNSCLVAVGRGPVDHDLLALA